MCCLVTMLQTERWGKVAEGSLSPPQAAPAGVSLHHLRVRTVVSTPVSHEKPWVGKATLCACKDRSPRVGQSESFPVTTERAFTETSWSQEGNGELIRSLVICVALSPRSSLSASSSRVSAKFPETLLFPVLILSTSLLFLGPICPFLICYLPLCVRWQRCTRRW